MPRLSQRPDERIDVGPELWQAFRAKLAAARLTDRQRRFVTAYIKRPFGARASRAAGYSPRRDRQQAYDNLRKPHVRRLIEEGLCLFERDLLVGAGLLRPDARRIPRELRYKSAERSTV